MHGLNMRWKWGFRLLSMAALAVTAFDYGGEAWATPAAGFASTTVIRGKFGEVDIFNHSIAGSLSEDEGRIRAWLSQQKVKGSLEIYVQSNVWQPGGSTGWHIHSGRSLILVKEGAVTEYEGHDPECKAVVYTKGMMFVDGGGGHVHILRNEGNVVAQTTAIQLIPADTARRIDVADPGNCHF
jgi:hypothetical protein